ncbi:uncharacterized protein LOC116873258 [Lontra canadensis]|uniref:uncharacterized protein LOC116873258 n=1 Tax=Lontra canadensis TaxID=76717 RepID=UPI0013F32B79|nr:uncharacterized protein LOC116873258 [Lontra canadensis]
MKEQAQVFSKDIRQVDLDVNRTFRNHIMFRDRYGIGWWPGMSDMVAILLMFLCEEDAFWALAQLMTLETHAMHGFFAPGFPKLARFQRHHDDIMEKELKGLKKHLDEQGMSAGVYTTKWFLQCFIGRVRLPRQTRSLTCTRPWAQGKPELSLTLQTSQARPRGPDLRLTEGHVSLGADRPSAHSATSLESCRVMWAPRQEGTHRTGCRAPSDAAGGAAGPGQRGGLRTGREPLGLPEAAPPTPAPPQTPFALTLKLWDAYMLDGERVLTAMAYTVLRLYRKHLLKLPLEGLQGFLQDTLAQPWALEDEAVLKHLQASMAHLRWRKCDLPPPAGPEEFPKMPLGQDQVSPAPTALLPSPTLEMFSGADGLASPGPAAHAEQPGPLPCQAVLKAQQPLREGRSTRPLAAPLRPEAPGTLVLSRLPPQRCSSLPNLPGHQGGACRGPEDMALRPQPWVPFPSAPAGATPVATPQTWPQNISGSPGTRSPQPRKEEAVGSRTPFLTWGLCSSWPCVGLDRPSRDTSGPALSPQHQGPAPARAPLTGSSTGNVDSPRPLEKNVGAKRLWAASTVPCLLTLDFVEDGTPTRRYKSLT